MNICRFAAKLLEQFSKVSCEFQI